MIGPNRSGFEPVQPGGSYRSGHIYLSSSNVNGPHWGAALGNFTEALNGAGSDRTDRAPRPGWGDYPMARTGSDGNPNPPMATLLERADDLDGAAAADSDPIAHIVINGTGANDILIGTDADEKINGLAGNDKLDGKGGDNILVGGQGNDTYFIGVKGSHKVVERAGEGSDLVHSNVSYNLGANVENLWLKGSADLNALGNELPNVLTGNNGTNTLNGAGGNDTLVSARGPDSLYGGDGNDVFKYYGVADLDGDAILDFEHGDKINLKAIDAIAGTTTNDAFRLVSESSGAAGEVWIKEEYGNTHIFADTGAVAGPEARLIVLGISHNLASSDFVL